MTIVAGYSRYGYAKLLPVILVADVRSFKVSLAMHLFRSILRYLMNEIMRAARCVVFDKKNWTH